jgi:hypothetical protein
MNPTTPDDAELDRLLTEGLDAEVQDVTAGPALLDRIKADAATTTIPGSRHRGRQSPRWLWPIAAAAAVVLAVVFTAVGGDDDTDVATGEVLDEARKAPVVLSGEAGGEEWSVVEYIEDDPSIVDEPTTCMRFEPPIEDGPFFCGTEDDLVGPHGRLVWRRSDRSGEKISFNGHAVFAGVFGPQVAEVSLRVAGERTVVEPTSWPGQNLGIVVVMLPVPDGAEYVIELTGADGEGLSTGGGSALEGTPGAEVPVISVDEVILRAAALPEASRRVVVVDADGLKTAVGLPSDHAFLPPSGPDDQMLLDELGAVLPHLRRPTDRGAAAALDAELVGRAAGNECAVGPECLTVVETRQDPDDVRRRLLAEGWSDEAGLLLNPGTAADVSYPVIGVLPNLVFLGQDQATVRDAIEGRTAPPERLVAALDRVVGPARIALACGESTAAIGSTPDASHQVASQATAAVEVGDEITIAGDEYVVAAVTESDGWTVVTIEPTDGSARSLTHLADPNGASVLPAVLTATFSC